MSALGSSSEMQRLGAVNQKVAVFPQASFIGSEAEKLIQILHICLQNKSSWFYYVIVSHVGIVKLNKSTICKIVTIKYMLKWIHVFRGEKK